MNIDNKTFIAEVERIFGEDIETLFVRAKELALTYERYLNMSRAQQRKQYPNGLWESDIQKGRIRLSYSTNPNTWGGIKNGGGKGWYLSGPVNPGIVDSIKLRSDSPVV